MQTHTDLRFQCSRKYPVFGIVLAIIIFISWAIVPVPVAGSTSLKFEDHSTKMESLADDTAILLPLHAVAHYYKVDFQWNPDLEQMLLSKGDTEVKVVLGNRHILSSGTRDEVSLMRPLSRRPSILKGAVALPPQDIASILSELHPDMDVSWDEAEATIEVKKRNISPESASDKPLRPQADTDQSGRNGKFELKTIVIDPGHGGYDPGAVKRGAREKHVVLDVSRRLKKLIESESKWEVILTRDSDEYISLQRRAEIANQYPAGTTLFISIHCNADPSTRGRGLETFVFNMEATDAEAAALAERENAEEKMDLAYILSHCYHVGNEPYSLEAAKSMQTTLVKRLKLRNRGVKRAPFYVLAGTKMPAILIELGFISNYYDRNKLQSASFRQSAAEALFKAIEDFGKATGKKLVKTDLG